MRLIGQARVTLLIGRPPRHQAAIVAPDFRGSSESRVFCRSSTAEGKHRLTTTYAWFLARWAKRLSWTEVAEAFRTTWEQVFRAVEMAVTLGRQHHAVTGITTIGIDELEWRRGREYLTLVYQLDAGAKRLVWLGEHRRVKTLLRFFRWGRAHRQH
ncbi:MAG: transposase [Candidatus Rokubacteria bacterium]|nr:transposase [Candidatus Rokubacteria bacterium]